MKLRNVVTGTLVLTLLLLSGCGGGGGGDPMNVAEQFMDKYYTKASLQEAKALATPAAAQQMEEKFGPAAGADPAAKQTSGEVSYTLKEKNKEGKHSYVVYEVNITSQEAGPVRKEVYLSIDVVDGAWKIIQFDERAAGSAVPGQH